MYQIFLITLIQNNSYIFTRIYNEESYDETKLLYNEFFNNKLHVLSFVYIILFIIIIKCNYYNVICFT